jgi:hypothetical protein
MAEAQVTEYKYRKDTLPANTPMAGAKKSLFLFKDVSRIRVAADEGVQISAANGRAPLATPILAY